jgi:hypothetical protein
MLTSLLSVLVTLSTLEPPLPPPGRTPILVLDHAGPNAAVTALAFSPDASTLYVGGYDKLVRRYALRNGKYEPAEPLRVPLGPGNIGAVNAVAVSPDGKWVAVAGRAPIRGEVWSGSGDGVVTRLRDLPALMRRDQGVVYLFDTNNPQGGRVLRGQEAEVRALAFANPTPASGPALVTAGIEQDGDKDVGVVRVFDVATGKKIDGRSGFPTTEVPPGLAAWAAGKSLRVAVAWETGNRQANGGRLVVWDVPGGDVQELPEVPFTSALAVRTANERAAQLITGGATRLTTRGTDPVGNAGVVRLSAPADQFAVALAVAALNVKGAETTAALVRTYSRRDGSVAGPTELRLLDRNGVGLGSVSLLGMAAESSPILAASPDGRFVAVGGFADHRVEVYDAAALAGNKAVPDKLPGDPGDLARVRFLAGDRLWVGGANDTPERGGTAFDPVARVAADNDGKGKVDEPAGGNNAILPDPRAAADRVTFPRGSAVQDVTLPQGERWTAAAVHPGKPAWNPALGPVAAVAHTNDRFARTLITLFDAKGRQLLQLGGPALPVKSLAFSGTRALLAAVGEDRTVFVWSLRDLNRRVAVIDGVTVTTRGAEVVVASVDPASGSRGKLAEGDVIEKVGGAKGELQPVKTPFDVTLAVRGLPVGSEARVQVKGKAAPVVVPVGTAVGHRHPLLSLWVDPVADKNGRHNWIGWTESGPYDTNSQDAEKRIVWVTATGDPARPVAFAAANQYRVLYYKNDFLRFLLEDADFDAAEKRYVAAYPPRPPVLSAHLNVPSEFRGREQLVRAKADALTVSVADPSGLLFLDRALLRWRTLSRDGTPGPWRELPFGAGHTEILLPGYDWTRGEHRFQFALHPTPDAPPAAEGAETFVYIPPGPVLAVTADGKVPRGSDPITTKDAEVSVAALVSWLSEPADVTVMTSVPGSVPLVLPARAWGTFVPVKVKLNPPSEKTVIWVTARTRGDGVDPVLESRTVKFEVSQLPPPPPVLPPGVKLTLSTPHEPPTSPAAPLVMHTPEATLTASVDISRPRVEFQWDLGDGKWVPGKLDAKGISRQTITLPKNGNPVAVRVQACVLGNENNSPFAGDTVRVVFAALPEVALTRPPLVVNAPTLELTGTLTAADAAAPPATLAVVVHSLRTGASETLEAEIDRAAGTWRATVTLSPGENEFTLVVRNKWAETRQAAAGRVAYLRPPVLVSVAPIDVGTGLVGDAVALVATPRGVELVEFRVNNAAVAFRAEGKPVAVFGTVLQTYRGAGASVKGPDGKRLARVPVVVRNREGTSPEVEAVVNGMDPVPTPPPTIGLSNDAGSPISDGDKIRSDEPRFAFTVRFLSDVPLTRAGVWHGGKVGTEPRPVPGIDPKQAAPANGRHRLEVPLVLNLRPGENRLRVEAANAGDTAPPVEFTVNYTPKPVRVLIESVWEPGADGKPVERATTPGKPIRSAGAVLWVRGRVEWDAPDDPIGTDRNLSVVLFANQVAHLPVRLNPPKPGEKKRAFEVPAFLNAADTLLRIELRSDGRAGPVPQQVYKLPELQVACARPLDKQRLHVVIVGPEVPREQRAAVVRAVVEGVGGEVPADRPDFDRGTFRQPSFVHAELYQPLVHSVDRNQIATLLDRVKENIEYLSRQGGDGWVNDVVLVYYQGRDVLGKDGGVRLHTSVSLMYGPSKAGDYMLNVNDIAPLPGFSCAVVNVVDPKGEAPAAPLVATPMLRFPWKNVAGVAGLPVIFKGVVNEKEKFGDILSLVQERIRQQMAAQAGPTTARVPDEVLGRLFGVARR